MVGRSRAAAAGTHTHSYARPGVHYIAASQIMHSGTMIDTVHRTPLEFNMTPPPAVFRADSGDSSDTETRVHFTLDRHAPRSMRLNMVMRQRTHP